MNVASLLDPEIAAALATLPRSNAPLTNDTLPLTRASMVSMAQGLQLSDRVTRTDHTIAVAGGPDVHVRVHRAVAVGAEGDPAGDVERPGLVWMHGGGLVAGTHLIDDGRFDRWCPMFGVVGISVDYGLAPERPYPGPLDDCYAALQWVHEHASELGVRTDRVGIGGSSAGGCLAAGLALLARDRGELPIAFQALIYPMIDDRMINPSSSWDVPIWPPASNAFGWSSYLGDRYGTADVPSYAAAARATDVAGLPPTFICVGALDGFVDEDIDYATRLNRSGVPTELHLYPGAPHGFDLLLPGSRLARRARLHLEEWLAAVLA
ncbi:MAG: Acetyl esterase/lipase [Ilumatobacteraceae bacterium]|nr:Acetyl esterase/lipase [Ilumatobacteraceae bacterium]